MRTIVHVACLMLALILCACGGGGTQSANVNAPAANANAQEANAQGSLTNSSAPVAGPAHARAGTTPPSSSSSSSSSMGGQAEAIDTAKYDAEVQRLQKQVDKKSGSESDRAALAHAYLDRAKALTKAKQYRAALGDYRRTLKYDPANDEAKNMAGTIIAILQQMGREVPTEGAEPSPLPYKQ